MAQELKEPTVRDQVKDLRDQVEVALLTRINGSVQQATPQELRELLSIYQELVTSDWYAKR